MTPEELTKERKEFEEDKKTYPPFLVEKFRKSREEIRIEEKIGRQIPYHPTKITDFLQLICAIWVISSKPYQENFWRNRREYDSYNGTIEIFLEDAEGVLEANNPPDDPPIEMTQKQREMLQKLYDMIEDYEVNPNAVEDLNCDYTDGKIIEDQLFAKCREYAKLVYEELSGDDLDAWEKSRTDGE